MAQAIGITMRCYEKHIYYKIWLVQNRMCTHGMININGR